MNMNFKQRIKQLQNSCFFKFVGATLPAIGLGGAFYYAWSTIGSITGITQNKLGLPPHASDTVTVVPPRTSGDSTAQPVNTILTETSSERTSNRRRSTGDTVVESKASKWSSLTAIRVNANLVDWPTLPIKTQSDLSVDSGFTVMKKHDSGTASVTEVFISPTVRVETPLGPGGFFTSNSMQANLTYSKTTFGPDRGTTQTKCVITPTWHGLEYKIRVNTDHDYNLMAKNKFSSTGKDTPHKLKFGVNAEASFVNRPFLNSVTSITPFLHLDDPLSTIDHKLGTATIEVHVTPPLENENERPIHLLLGAKGKFLAAQNSPFIEGWPLPGNWVLSMNNQVDVYCVISFDLNQYVTLALKHHPNWTPGLMPKTFISLDISALGTNIINLTKNIF